ncbi:MAG: GAF domain-containing protein [Paracoccaceae bacterium]
MHKKVSWCDDVKIVAKADKVAAELSNSVKCDGVFISLANRNRLFSFGMASAEGPNDNMRSHEYADSICGVTIDKNTQLVLSDARKTEEFSTIPYVSEGHIVGYLGQPIRDAEARAIGAICAISSEPRVWSESDKRNLQMSCVETEYLLATELLQREMVYLSQALGEYDSILMSLANNIDLMTSVHSENGELLFATKTLLDELDVSSLEDGFRRYQKYLEIMKKAEGGKMLHLNDNDPSGSGLLVRGKFDKNLCWRANIQKTPGSVSFASWSVVQSGHVSTH